MTSDMITVTTQGPVTTLCLNRPDKANALTGDMLADLAGAVQGAQGQKALILTGTGKVFSAGADLEAARAGLATSPLWETLSGAIAAFDGLSICALNGTVAGGAFGMVLACDLRIAVPGARFFYPVMKLGFLPQPSDPQRLRAIAGPSAARMILMAGQKLDSAAALRCGLVDELADADALIPRAHALTEAVTAATPAHAAAIRAMIG